MIFKNYCGLITFLVCLHGLCDAEPLIWFSTRDSIKTTDVGTYKTQDIVNNVKWVSSISPFRDHIYWTQTESNYYPKQEGNMIMRAKKDGSDVQKLVSFGKDTLKSIAVDFVTGDIYYASATNVGVCNNDGSNCRILYTDYVNDPSGLVLYPQRGQMYWGNEGQVRMIVAASMNGTSVRPLLAKNIISPENLVIDFDTDRLYWADFTSYRSIKLDGTDYRQIYSLIFANSHGVAVYGDRMYMTYSDTIDHVDKLSGRDRETIAYSADYIYDIQIEQHVGNSVGST